MLTFGPRYSQLFWGLLDEYATVHPDDLVCSAMQNFQLSCDKINFFDLTPENKLSYMPANRLKSESSGFTGPGRQAGKLGGTLRKVLPPAIPEKELKKFVESFTALVSGEDLNVEIFTGKDIPQWYDWQSYAPNSEGSELGKSCMRHASCAPYLKFYTGIPTLSLAVLFDDKRKVLARALMWDDVVLKNTDIRDKLGTDRVKVMERIYAVSPQCKFALQRWGRKRVDLLHAIPKDAATFILSKTGDTVANIKLETTIPNGWCYYYPWVDSLYYLDPASGKLSNYVTAGTKPVPIGLHATDGRCQESVNYTLERIRKHVLSTTDASVI